MSTYVGSLRAGFGTSGALTQKTRGAWWFVGAIFAIGLAMIGIGLAIVSELRKETLTDERNQALNLVNALALDVERVIADVDAKLQAIGQTLEAPYFQEAKPELKWPLLFGAGQEHRTIAQIRVLDRYGDMLHAKKRDVTTTAGDQLSVLYHAHARHDELHIGPVLGDADGDYTLSLSRRFERNGQFAGVVVAEMPLAFIEQAFLAIKTDRSTILALIHNEDRIAVHTYRLSSG